MLFSYKNLMNTVYLHPFCLTPFFPNYHGISSTINTPILALVAPAIRLYESSWWRSHEMLSMSHTGILCTPHCCRRKKCMPYDVCLFTKFDAPALQHLACKSAKSNQGEGGACTNCHARSEPWKVAKAHIHLEHLCTLEMWCEERARSIFFHQMLQTVPERGTTNANSSPEEIPRIYRNSNAEA